MTPTSFYILIATLSTGAIVALIWSPTIGAILYCIAICICAFVSLK